MEKFTHIRIVIGIILSLSIAHLLKGVSKIIEHPGRNRPYWIHLLWVFYVFLQLIYFWWWEFSLGKLMEWTFVAYIFIIFYIILFYILSSLLFPDDLKDYGGYREYFYSRRKWFFALLGATFLVDIGDTLLKGRPYMEHLGGEYPIRVAVHFLLCLIAIRVRKEWFHAILVTSFILYGFSWILRRYMV
jgi:hypothetical protein